MSKIASTIAWEPPAPTDEFLSKHAPDLIDSWRVLIAQVREIADANGWTKAEVARRSGIPDGTLSQVLSGKYLGLLANQNAILARWIDSVEQSANIASMIPVSPEFNPRLRMAQEVIETLVWAQIAPAFVMITLPAGTGKSEACKHFVRTRPHAYMATMSENTCNVHSMLVELAAALEVNQNNPAKLTRSIGKRLERTGGGTLLIVDEAQHLSDQAINQVRHFKDVYSCGVALVGNSEVYARFARKEKEGPSYDQIKRRVSKHLRRAAPYVEDVKAYIAAWGVTAPDCVKFLLGIGMKGGAMGQIDETMRIAHMVANGLGEPLSLQHIQVAWKNRDVGELA